ncbi:MAG TPA: TIGR03915 family putative DNA repair protein [Gemmatirosa sp.]
MPAVAFDGTFDGWRAAARGVLAAALAPADVTWQPADDLQRGLALDTVSAANAAHPVEARTPAAVTVPRRFLAVGALVACHRDPERWATLYRVLWRLTCGGEPHLLAVAVDRDVLQLTRMAKAVRREVHKLHAFVRFRLVRAADGVDEYVAWFEPEHDVVERAAALFVRRFANMRWAVLTPRASVRWDGVALSVGPGVMRHEAPSADALEQLWTTYYAHVFNPARVKLDAMRAEMPKRYWRNLPEAALIAPMVRDAPARVRRMVEAAATPHVRPGAARATLSTPLRTPDADAAPAARAIAPTRIGRALVYTGSAAWEEHADDAPHDAAERLRRHAARYPLAVVASTRGRVFAPALAAVLTRHAPAGLFFDPHAHAAMLGGSVRPFQLPRAIRELLPPSLAGAERVAGELVPDRVRDAIWERFVAATDVLATNTVLGAVLLGVPRRLAPGRETAARLRDWLARLPGRAVAVQFADPTWGTAAVRARTDALLATAGATRVLRDGDEDADEGELAVLTRASQAGIARVARRVARVHVLGTDGSRRATEISAV